MMTDQAMSGLTGGGVGMRGSRSMLLKGRLREGVTPEQADGVLGIFSTALAQQYPRATKTG